MTHALLQTDPQVETNNRMRNALAILGALMLAALAAGGLTAYVGVAKEEPLLLAAAGALALEALIGFRLFFLVRKKGETTQAMSYAIALFLTDMIFAPVLAQGLGLPAGISAFVVTLTISSLTLPPKNKPAGIIGGVTVGALAYALDTLLGKDRLASPPFETYAPYAAAGVFILIFIVVIHEFRDFSLRLKVAFGILATGAIAVSALTVFSIQRADGLVTVVASKFENSITAQLETEISATAQREAQRADDLFANTLKNLQALAKYREKLESRKELFAEGKYWNGAEKVIQLPAGAYGNSSADLASIFIPKGYLLDEALIADMNTTAYLDFAAPSFLEANPRVVAVYYMSALGTTTYYPNINLAEIIVADTPDYDPLTQPFFTIADPRNNPERLPRWTPAYQDPAGRGLVVSLCIPVYEGNVFKGVLGADLQLAPIIEAVSSIQLGRSGFAFLVDGEGHILAMPPHGYSFFGLQPEEIPLNESPKRSLMSIDRSVDLTQMTWRMIKGETDLVEIQLNGAEHYLAFTPLQVVDYRLGAVALKSEMSAAIGENRKEVETEKTAALGAIFTLLVALFIVATGISLGIGQIIAGPLARLTKTVERIAGGDTSARAAVENLDETGQLAASVNTMNAELKNILANLEMRIGERTLELEKSNEVSARRAAQFETVARIARTISATQSIETLLPQIAEAISKQFNFYHVGVFLLDNRREYAILVAANSEGGQRMLARNHRLLVGEIGIVGYVTSIGQPRVALDVGADAVYFNNPDLPNTHSEVALPLRIGSDTFGALDVQSTERNAFSSEDVSILSTLADQVSVAIQNARSYQQSREALEQAERVSSQLSGQQWQRFIGRQEIGGYYFDGTDIKTLDPEYKRRPHHLSIPLTLRGAQIGAIKIRAANPDHEWSDDELAFAQAAADRAALALENARLLEESQKRAAKERAISEISAKIGSVTDLASIIETAIQELGYAMPGADIAVQFTDAEARRE